MHSLERIIGVHSEFREHVATRIHGQHEATLEPAYATVLFRSFTYCFNTYKAIGLLLPDRYYEYGCALLRVMWEASLNLAWVSQKPDERSRAFLQFTVVETHRVYRARVLELEAKGDRDGAAPIRTVLTEFENEHSAVLDEYRIPSSKGPGRLAQRFSLGNLEAVASELGAPWSVEYRGIYPLLCSYAHGSHGVILFPKPFVKDFEELEAQTVSGVDEPRTVNLALWSMAVFERSYGSFLQALGADDRHYLDDVENRVAFRRSLRR